GYSLKKRREVEVVTHGKTRFAGLADNLLLFDWFALFDLNGAQMAVQGREAEAVVDDNGVAIDAQIPDKTHDPAVGCFHGVSFGYREVKTEVIGGIDSFITIDVGPRICEVGLNLGIRKLDEGAAPQHPIGSFLTDHADLVFVFLAQTMIYLDEDIL